MSSKISIRPQVKKIGTLENKLPHEKFQNETLRPILKLQHELLTLYFENHLIHIKIKWHNLNETQKLDKIDVIFKKDNQFKTEIRGLIIGHFTVDEFKTYQTFQPEANKRILNLIKEKIISSFALQSGLAS